MKVLATVTMASCCALVLAACANAPGRDPADLRAQPAPPPPVVLPQHGDLQREPALASAMELPPSAPLPPVARGAAPVAAAAAQRQATNVRVMLARTQSAQGLTALQLQNGTVWYDAQPVLTRADLAQATALRGSDNHGIVRLTFNAVGARKLALIAQRFQGNYLVLFVGDRAVSVPRVTATMAQGALDVVVGTPAQALQITQAINGGAVR